MAVRGDDISNHQGQMDVENVNRLNFFGFTFILTNDGTVINHYFHQQADAAERAGSYVVPYVYLRPNWAQTVDIHMGVVGDRYDESIVDVEDGSGGWNECWNAHRLLWDNGRSTPLLYWPNFHWQSMGSPDLSSLRRSTENPRGVKALWKSWYPDREWDWYEDAYSKVPSYVWNDVRGGIPTRILQFTGTGRVQGYGGNVDLNYFPGSMEELGELLDKKVQVPDVELNTQVRLYDHNTGQGENYTYQDAIWGIHFHAKEADFAAHRVEARLAAMENALTKGQAQMMAAIKVVEDEVGDIGDDVQLTDEQLAKILGIFPATIRTAMAEFYRRAAEQENRQAQPEA